MLKLNRSLDLSVKGDRQELVAAVTQQARHLLPSLMEHVDCLSRFFPGVEWCTVHDGGIVNVRTSEKGHRGFDLTELLQLVSAIKRLQEYHGFDELLSGFKNPTQIESTNFELRTADWCHHRAVSQNIEFAPRIKVRGRIKRPEFVWHTTLGSCFCECKSASFLQNAAHVRLSRMTQLLDRHFKSYSNWDDQLRLDVTFGRGTTNYLHRQFPFIIDKAKRALKESDPLAALICVDDITARFRPRTEEPPQNPDTIRMSLATVGPVSTELRAATHLSVSMDLTGYRSEATARLVRDAKTQLPTDATGLVFLENVGHVSAMRRLRTLLTYPNFERTPWVSLWSFSECRGAVWRNGQPLNGSLLSKAGGEASIL